MEILGSKRYRSINAENYNFRNFDYVKGALISVQKMCPKNETKREKTIIDFFHLFKFFEINDNKIESQSKTASRLFENKIKTMSRP